MIRSTTAYSVRKATTLILPPQRGKAWLEISIECNRLVVTAHYYPKGLWGRLYWLLTKPLHKLIFPDMAKGIIKKARQTGQR